MTFLNAGIVNAESCLCVTIHWGPADGFPFKSFQAWKVAQRGNSPVLVSPGAWMWTMLLGFLSSETAALLCCPCACTGSLGLLVGTRVLGWWHWCVPLWHVAWMMTLVCAPVACCVGVWLCVCVRMCACLCVRVRTFHKHAVSLADPLSLSNEVSEDNKPRNIL